MKSFSSMFFSFDIFIFDVFSFDFFCFDVFFYKILVHFFACYGMISTLLMCCNSLTYCLVSSLVVPMSRLHISDYSHFLLVLVSWLHISDYSHIAVYNTPAKKTDVPYQQIIPAKNRNSEKQWKL